jgi:hypothetical protein
MTEKIVITKRASASEVHQAKEAEHIKPNELARLINQMTGRSLYEPRLGGSGQKKRCLAGGCLNWALGGARKQLCPTHYAGFLEKSNRAQAMPVCSGNGCNVHTRATFEGQPMCVLCSNAERASRNKAADVVSYEGSKRTELENAETVHELKEWIKEYML